MTQQPEAWPVGFILRNLNCVMSRCKNMEVPVDKIYNKTQREKFAWAIDMTEEDFLF